jgi:hypothetical protein
VEHSPNPKNVRYVAERGLSLSSVTPSHPHELRHDDIVSCPRFRALWLPATVFNFGRPQHSTEDLVRVPPFSDLLTACSLASGTFLDLSREGLPGGIVGHYAGNVRNGATGRCDG